MCSFSVVIPVYEAKEHLGRCVDSWLGQTKGDLELILVDDGSTDGSGELCDWYAGSDQRVRVIHQENAGVSVARNAGIERAKGTYVLFTDSDDYVAEDYLEQMDRAMEESGADLTLCGFHHLYDGADIRKLPGRTRTVRLLEGAEDFLSLYEQSFLNMPWNKMYKRERMGRFDPSLSLGEDLLFNLDYLTRCEKIAVLSNPLCYYIQEEQKVTLSSEKRKDRLFLAKRVCQETEEFYDRLFGKQEDPLRKRGHQRIFTRYMNEVMDECEKLPVDKSLSVREKIRSIRAYGEDPWVKERGDEAVFSYLDYRILWFFLRRQRAGMVYGLCVLRRALVALVHWIRRKGRT
ncbi:MAG: glycosyltransferase family 2 protein [Lachnospiraceae bacterium]|nr:glycosyltransferase family 2 protein [Lachnospiraceae bacterium]